MRAVRPELTEDGPIRFGEVELDLLATHAGVPMPFPLRVPSFGRIAGERAALLAAAGWTLRASGMADSDGPVGAAAELVTALRRHRGTVDMVLIGPAAALGVVALVYDGWALVCCQWFTGDLAGVVLARRVQETALTAELFAMVPEFGPANAMPITLPARAVRDAAEAVRDGSVLDGADPEQRLRDLVAECGGDPRVLPDLTGLVSTLYLRGQAGATRRRGTGGVRAGGELSWLDGPRGRVRVNDTNDGWVSVNPLADLRSALDELVMTAREAR